MEPTADNGAFKPIHQPYSVGTPVRDREIFFGRQDDFRFVRERLLAEREGIVLSLVGPRRSGKTSIMVQIQKGELGEKFLPLFIDMQQMAGVVGDRDFFARMAALILESLDDTRLVIGYYDFAEGSPIVTFDTLLGDIKKAYPDRRLLFLVDEAEILETKVDNGEISTGVLTYMSSILENLQVSFCLTGSPGMIQIEGEDWRRLTAKGDYREISYLTRDDTYRLIQEPVAGALTYDDGVVERIYQLTAGWPFYVQLACFYLVVHLNQEQRNRATDADVDAVVRAIVNNPPPQLVYQWEELEERSKIALALVGEQSQEPHQEVSIGDLHAAIRTNKYPLDLKDESLNVALDNLYTNKHLERTDEGTYFFRVDLFRQWIRRHRSVWRLIGQKETPRRSRAWWALAPVALACFAMAFWWFARGTQDETAGIVPDPILSKAGKLWVESQPADVRVLVDGDLHSSGTPTTIGGLAPGTYAVRVEHDKYQPQEQQIQISEGMVDTLRFIALQRLQGGLAIKANPPGAQVRIEGEVDTSGTAPLTDLALPTGDYRISVSMPGYVAQTRHIRIAAGEKREVAVMLTARIGRVQISSVPDGAQVFVDGQAIEGRTPLDLSEVAEGRHTIRFELADHQPLEKTVVVERGATVIAAARLTLLPATVLLKSQPVGAKVYVDGSDSLWGTTPLTLSLPPGKHRIALQHAGYDTRQIEKEWHPGQTDRMPPVALKRQFGAARFVRPLSGELYVDGQLKKKGVLGNIRFAVGDYVFRIGDKEKTVKIHKDSTIVVQFE